MNDFLSVVAPYKVILLDAHGVFWEGSATGLYPGVLEAFTALKAAGKIVGILMNGTTRSMDQIAAYAKKVDLHLGKHYDFLITSGEVVHRIFASEGLIPFDLSSDKYFVFAGRGTPGLRHDSIFQGTPYTATENIQEAGFIYIDVPRIENIDQIHPEAFEADVKVLVSSELPIVCANPDYFALEGNPPRPVVRQGTIAKLYEKHGGIAYCFGKPHPPMFEHAFSILADQYNISDKKQIVMVGDTPRTDIYGGNHAGIATVLVSKTGISAAEISDIGIELFLKQLQEDYRPTHVVPGFSIEKKE